MYYASHKQLHLHNLPTRITTHVLLSLIFIISHFISLSKNCHCLDLPITWDKNTAASLNPICAKAWPLPAAYRWQHRFSATGNTVCATSLTVPASGLFKLTIPKTIHFILQHVKQHNWTLYTFTWLYIIFTALFNYKSYTFINKNSSINH